MSGPQSSLRRLRKLVCTAGHPRLRFRAAKTWMAGTSPAMTRRALLLRQRTALLVGDVDPDAARVGHLVFAGRALGEHGLAHVGLLAAAERHRGKISAAAD